MNAKLKITDDSGFIAIANPDTYVSFVDNNWELPQLSSRFVDEMNKDNLIIFATGLSGQWTVLFCDNQSNNKAFREFTKSINVTNGQLCLTNYEDLTMAAQFNDERIPATHNADLIIKLDNGFYNITVRQMFNPQDFSYEPEGKVNFEIIIRISTEPSTTMVEKVFWLSD